MVEIMLMWDKIGAKSIGANGGGYAKTIGHGNMIVEDLMIESQAPDGKTKAIFEDNGEVAYCYIIENGTIISDVWLYNRAPAPRLKPWKSGTLPPYLNPMVYSQNISKFPEENDVRIAWDIKDKKPIAFIMIFGEIFGYVSSLTQPGHARLAVKDGPLAKTMRGNVRISSA